MTNYYQSPQQSDVRKPYFRKFVDRLGYVVIGMFVVALFVFAAMLFGIVQFDYLEVVHNDPLNAAVSVTKVVGNTVHLADGRCVVLDRYAEPSQVLYETDGRLELETANGQTSAYVSRERCICGTGMRQGLIQIPFIPRRIEGNRRWQVSDNVMVLPAATAATSNTP